MQHDELWDKVCSGKFEELNDKIDKIAEAIIGNGKPGHGERLRDLERFQKRFVAVLLFLLTTGGVQVFVLIKDWLEKGS